MQETGKGHGRPLPVTAFSPNTPPPSRAWARDTEEGGAGRAGPLGKRPPTLKTRASVLAALQVQYSRYWVQPVPRMAGQGPCCSSVLMFKGAWHGAQEGLITPQSPNQAQNHYGAWGSWPSTDCPPPTASHYPIGLTAGLPQSLCPRKGARPGAPRGHLDSWPSVA